MPRYKVVVQSVIGEVRGQGVRVTSRCLWDQETDSYVSFNWNNVRGLMYTRCCAPLAYRRFVLRRTIVVRRLIVFIVVAFRPF
jgi:hypothetical protein